MNCKHGAVVIDPGNFITTAPDVEVVSCACCGAALRLISARMGECPPDYCNICTEGETLSVSVCDDPSIEEGM